MPNKCDTLPLYRASLRGDIAYKNALEQRKFSNGITIKIGDAIADANEAIRIKPNYAKSYLVRASLNLFDKESALTNLRKAASLYQQQGNKNGYEQALKQIQTVEDISQKTTKQ